MKVIFIVFLLLISAINASGNEVEEEIFEVSTLNGVILSDPIVGLSKKGIAYLPLLDIAKVLGVATEQTQPVEFKIFKTESDFKVLNFTGCPDPHNVDCKSSLIVKGQLFLSIDYMQNTLDWPLSVDLKTLRILVNVQSRASEAYVKKAETTKPYILNRNKFGYPSMRAEATMSTVPGNDVLNLYETQPLLEQNSDVFLSQAGSQTSFRWTLSKEFIEPQSSFAVKNYELGSTLSLDTKYLYAPSQITGFHISNIQNNENIFDTQNLYEKGPPRWKVELTVNQIYMGETFVDALGNFSFLNIPVFYGSNRIHYRMTSPIGQVVEMDRNYEVSNEFEGVGKVKYQAAFGQEMYKSDYLGGGFVNYGLLPTVSTQAGFAQFVLSSTGELKKFSLVGVSFLQPQFSLSTSQLSSMTGPDRAWVVSPKVNLGRTLVTGEFVQFKKFQSLLINSQASDDLNGLKKISTLSNLGGEIPIIAQVSYLESNYNSVPATEQVQVRAYTMFSSSSVLVESNKFWPSNYNPDLYIEYGNYSKDLRGKYGVQIQDDRYAKTKLEIDYLFRADAFLTLSADVPPTFTEGAYSLGVNNLWGPLQTQADLISSPGQVAVNLTLSTNLRPSSKGYKMSQDENYRLANIELFAFLDENSNGHFDLGEKPYPQLRILEARRQKEYETDSNGLVIISGVNPYERVSLEVVKESISNIFLTAQSFQSDYILTPAEYLRIEIPIKPSFDVRGQLVNHHFKKLVPLEVIDDSNHVISTTVTSSNGKYKFTELPGGIYYIRVNPAYLVEQNLTANPSVISIDLNGKAGGRVASSFEISAKNSKK